MGLEHSLLHHKAIHSVLTTILSRSSHKSLRDLVLWLFFFLNTVYEYEK